MSNYGMKMCNSQSESAWCLMRDVCDLYLLLILKIVFPLGGGLASYVHLSAIWGNLSITHPVRIGVSVFTSLPLAKLFFPSLAGTRTPGRRNRAENETQ